MLSETETFSAAAPEPITAATSLSSSPPYSSASQNAKTEEHEWPTNTAASRGLEQLGVFIVAAARTAHAYTTLFI